ncbi:unnamed protein product [Linum trigynum]|uniref:Reverse transcriptase zinc-binding domain-containing protein n=1 Tax=Linum trigynum TaxID=586398 RepID=A0AAV2FWB4_9ROSI
MTGDLGDSARACGDLDDWCLPLKSLCGFPNPPGDKNLEFRPPSKPLPFGQHQVDPLHFVVSSSPLPDKLIWHYSSNGVYNVKSGYQVLLEDRAASFDPLPHHLDSKFWKCLWNLPIPPKLKIFLWRLVRGFLPLCTVLKQKTLCDVDTCPICSVEAETFSHCFFNCRIARGLWELAGQETIRQDVCVLTPDVAWHRIFFSLQLSKVQIAEIVFLSWRVWKARCWSVHDRVQYLPPALVRQFRSHLSEWQDVSNGRQPSQPMTRQRGEQPPTISCPPGGILIRFDGAFRKYVGGSSGFVGFAEDSSLVCAYGKFYAGLNDPFLSELLALRDSMLWCLQHGFYNVCFCGDSQLVIRRVAKNAVQHETGGAILEEVCLLRSSFQFSRFAFASRRTNRAAHLVAKTALALVARHSVDYRYLLFNSL